MSILPIPRPSACPVCGSQPYVERCEPWPQGHGPAPWAAGCYSQRPFEHLVGVNGDNQLDAIKLWNSEVEKIATGDFESAAV